MEKIKAFNFVELLLVMMILGVIITLTMPLMKKLKDDDAIYRAYLKKASQDVTGVVTMSLMKNKYFDGFNKLGNAFVISKNALYTNNNTGLRYAINTSLTGKECTGTTCFSAEKKGTFDTSLPGIKLGKTIWLFEYSKNESSTPYTYGYIYIDMNGEKSPNAMCKDRYRFIVYQDRAALDMEDATWGCGFEIEDD